MRSMFPVALVLSLIAAGCASKSKTEAAPPAKAPSASHSNTPVAPTKAEVKEPAKKVVDTAASEKQECTSGKDVRTLEIRKKDKGCELAYTKAGQEAVVSTSVNGSEHCEASLTKIKDNLAKAGFTCK